jgi:hypothetical protein
MKLNTQIQEEIKKLTGLSHHNYCHMQYMYAYVFLDKYLAHNDSQEKEVAINYITRSKIFWNWWKLQWWNRDEQFIALLNLQVHAGTKAITKTYMSFNNPERLAIEAPHTLIDKGYCRMIDEVFKTKKPKRNHHEKASKL